jgi:hypothetical protein
MPFAMLGRMDTHPAGADRPTPPDPEELRLLADQLTRMRGMLFGYSERFFERIRTYLVLTLVLLVVAGADVFPHASLAVPFLVPFAFLETGYLFFYTVFARRHAEYLERAINSRFGRDVLVAHRLEAAYFYPPDAPKIAAISFGNPLGMMSVMTLGYTIGAALLWLAGLQASVALVQDGSGDVFLGIDATVVVIGAQLVWTVAIAGYLVYAFVIRADERRLVAELERSYGPAPARSAD